MSPQHLRDTAEQLQIEADFVFLPPRDINKQINSPRSLIKVIIFKKHSQTFFVLILKTIKHLLYLLKSQKPRLQRLSLGNHLILCRGPVTFLPFYETIIFHNIT